MLVECTNIDCGHSIGKKGFGSTRRTISKMSVDYTLLIHKTYITHLTTST